MFMKPEPLLSAGTSQAVQAESSKVNDTRRNLRLLPRFTPHCAGRSPQLGTAAMPAKKLFTVGFESQDALITKARLSETQWKQMSASYEHTPLSTSTAADSSGATMDTSIMAQQGHTGVAAAAIVGPGPHQMSFIQQLRAADRTLFIICWHPDATEDPLMRWQSFQSGANMVTYCTAALLTALQQVAQQQQQQSSSKELRGSRPIIAASSSSSSSSRMQSCQCDWCGLCNLSAAEYWLHQQLYHINHPNKSGRCQVCGRACDNIARHLHDHHDPTGKPPEHRTGVFALAVVRRPSDHKLLMVQEFAGSGYWLPGGGVDQGETVVQGAVRECREEAGVEVELKGILDVEWQQNRQWRRVIFWGEPATTASTCCTSTSSHIPSSSSSSRTPEESCCSPKTLPNWESAGACWVDVAQLHELPLRHAAEPMKWFPVVAGGGEGLPRGLELPDECVDVFQGFV